MELRAFVLAGLAALAMAGCGKKDGAPAAPAAAANASAASPLESPYRLAGAKEVDVEALFSLLPEDERPTYARAKFDAKLGATIVSNLRFTDRHSSDPDTVGGLSIERAEFYGVDLAAIDRVKTSEAAADAPFEKIFQKVRLFSVKPDRAPDGSMTTIGAIEFDQLRLRHGGLPEQRGTGGAARFFNAFELAGLYIKDLVVESEHEASGAVSVKAPDLRIVGVSGGKLGAFIAKDFESHLTQSDASRALMAQTMGPAAGFLAGPLKAFFAPDDQRVTAALFEWRDIDLSGWMSYALKNKKPPLTARKLINFGTVKAVNYDMFIGAKRAAHIDELSVSAFEFAWLAPSKIRIDAKGGQYDFSAYLPESETDAVAALKQHGLDDVKAVSKFSWDWDAAKGGASFKSTVDSAGLADTTVSLDLAGLELEKIDQAMTAGDRDAAFQAGSFKGFSFSLADEKLLDALFALAALQMGTSPEELRLSAPALVRLSGAPAAAMNPRIADYVDAVAAFIGEGGTIEISAKPDAPVPFATIAAAGEAGPDSLPDLLDLEVTHTKKK